MQYLSLFLLIVLHLSFIYAQDEKNYITSWPTNYLYGATLPSSTIKYYSTTQDNQDSILIRSNTDIYLLYLEKVNKKYHNRHYTWNHHDYFRYDFKFNNNQAQFCTNYLIERRRFEYYNPGSGAINLLLDTQLSSLSINLPLYQKYLRFQLALGVREYAEKVFFYKTIGIGVNLLNELNLHYYFINDRLWWQAEGEYSSDRVKLNFPQDYFIHRYIINWKMNARIRIDLELHDNYVDQPNSLINTGFFLLPDARILNYKTAIYYSMHSIDLKMDYQRTEQNSHAVLRQNKMKFGSIYYFDQFYQVFKPAITWKRNSYGFLLIPCWGNGFSKGSGHAESWPFTPVWYDLLGLRSYAKFNLEYTFWRLGLQYYYLGEKSKLLVGLDFEQIRPEGMIRTWQPEFLAFGIQNLKINELVIKKQNGLYLILNWKRRIIKKLDLLYKITQYIPLSSSKTKKEKGEEGTAGEPSKSKKRFNFGGSIHSINLQWTF